MEEALRAFCLKLSISDSLLQPLPPECSFVIQIQVPDSVPATLSSGPQHQVGPAVYLQCTHVLTEFCAPKTDFTFSSFIYNRECFLPLTNTFSQMTLTHTDVCTLMLLCFTPPSLGFLLSSLAFFSNVYLSFIFVNIMV